MKFVSIEAATHDSIEQAIESAFGKIIGQNAKRLSSESVVLRAERYAVKHSVGVHKFFSGSRCETSREYEARRDFFNELIREGWSISKIAKAVGLQPATVSRALRFGGAK